jgi:D-xylose transport system substrate-binding protein
VQIRRLAAITSIAAIALAACSGGGATPSPSAASAPPAASNPPASAPASASSAATACHVGVSWPTFQEERYGLRDEPGLKGAVEKGGGTYTGNDAKLSPETQAANVEALINAGVNVLVVDAQDPQAILPSIQKAVDAGIPVIAYDREIENSKALFMTHDSVEVGRMIATAVTKAAPTGNYAIIKGDKTQTNPLFLSKGFDEVTKPLVDSGAIKIVAEENIDGWKPETAQTTMEQILTANNDNIQAVLSQNDGMATGVTAALGGNPGGKVKIGGQDADKAALNRVALGTQVVSVWKDATELGQKAGEAALELCKNPDISKVTGAVASKTTGGLDSFSLLLKPVPITRDNLQTILDAKWLTKDELCKDVPAGTVNVCG